MRRYYTEERLGDFVTYHQEDIPGDLSLDQWDTIQNIQGKPDLLICIGDSWTWGDSITKNLAGHNLTDPRLAETDWDKDQRRQLCYGAQLSKLMNTDWINYGFPGYSNIYILERFAKALNDPAIQKYQNIYFVLCLTETGREWSWIRPTNEHSALEADVLCAQSEKYILDKILEVYGDRDLNKLIICRNFTTNYATTQYHTDYLKTWIQVNWEHDSVDVSLKDIMLAGPATQIGIGSVEFLESYEEYVEKIYHKIDSFYTFLETSQFHSHKATKHPTAESHRLWAQYLHQQFLQGATTS